MPHLSPCPQCSRHVRADEARCPFCDRAIEALDRAPAAPSTRLGRAALMAFGTAVVAATAVASCGGAQSGSSTGGPTTQDGGPGEPPPPDPREREGNRSRDPDDANMAKPYGAPPADGLLHVV
jgi:hypothetical protein